MAAASKRRLLEADHGTGSGCERRSDRSAQRLENYGCHRSHGRSGEQQQWQQLRSDDSWKQITGPEVVVNDVLIDPRNDSKIMVATDRMGVLVSSNNGSSFEATNRGSRSRDRKWL